MEAILRCGLIEDGANVVSKRECDFDEDDRQNIENVIINTIADYVRQILNSSKYDLEDIELIGIAAPRKD